MTARNCVRHAKMRSAVMQITNLESIEREYLPRNEA
jgi:hypothetical protein